VPKTLHIQNCQSSLAYTNITFTHTIHSHSFSIQVTMHDLLVITQSFPGTMSYHIVTKYTLSPITEL